jgi:hypothetical protein
VLPSNKTHFNFPFVVNVTGVKWLAN